MGKKINQLLTATDSEAVDPNKLLALADPVTGEAKQMTIAQARLAFTPQKIIYTATGAEGVTITLNELRDKDIQSIARPSGEIFEVDENPESNEFSFDGIDITLGTQTNTGEKFRIIYTYA